MTDNFSLAKVREEDEPALRLCEQPSEGVDNSQVKDSITGIAVTIESGGVLSAKGFGNVSKKNLLLHQPQRSRNDESTVNPITSQSQIQ